MHNSNEPKSATPPAGFKPTLELSAGGTRIWEGQDAYIGAGSHGVTPTWCEDGGTRFLVDAALRPLTPHQLDEFITVLINVRHDTTNAEPEPIGPILGRVVEDLRLRAGVPVGS